MNLSIIKQKTLRLTLLMFIILILSSCNVNNLNEVKINNAFVNEYNEAIKDYNKLAENFTELARFMNKSLTDTDINTRFWKDYDKKRNDVVSSINHLNNFEFMYQENKLCMENINPLINNVEKYLNKIDTFRRDNSDSYFEFNEQLKNLYNNILYQSNIVSSTFDNIYEQYIVQ